MLLSLDLGNTSLKLVLWDGARARQRVRIPNGEAVDPELRASLAAVTRCVGVASHGVLEREPESLLSLRALLSLAPAWVGRGLEAPATVVYDDASELGIDRRLVVWGARALGRGGNCLVVDGGTAVTFTHIDSADRIRGLAIGAGYRTQREGLGLAAPALARFLGGALPEALPRGTRDNLAVGIDVAWAGGMRALLRDARRRLRDRGVECGRVLVTGSDAGRLREALGAGRVADDLVHHGLRALAGEA